MRVTDSGPRRRWTLALKESMKNTSTSRPISFSPVTSSSQKKQNPIFGQPNPLDKILKSLGRVDLRKKYNLSNSNRVSKAQESSAVVEEICEAASKLSIGLCLFDQTPHFFNGSFWESVPSAKLMPFLLDAAKRIGLEDLDHKHHSFRADLHSQFLSRMPVAPDRSGTEKTVINFVNGSLDVTKSDRILRSPRPADYIRYQLPFYYDPTAQCPKWQKFLDDVIPDRASQNRLSEFFGYVLSDMKLEKVLFLCGSGANGKSVVFEVVSALLGRENISHYDLSELSNDLYRPELAHKLLNYSSELSRTSDIANFKRMASGEPITVKQLYKQPYQVHRYAKLAFNCNNLPATLEDNEAFFRRLLVIPFDRTIEVKNRNPYLAAQIIEAELPGIFNWVLEGLDRLAKNSRFTDSQKADQLLTKYRTDADPTAEFIEVRGYEISRSPKDKLTLKEIYEDFSRYCLETGEDGLSARELKKAFERRGFAFRKLSTGQVTFATRRTSDDNDEENPNI